MLFGGEIFRKVAFTAFMAVRRGGDRASSSSFSEAVRSFDSCPLRD